MSAIVSSDHAARSGGSAAARLAHGAEALFLTIEIAGHHFGLPVLQVQDVLGPQKLTVVPLAPPEVAGSLNLRGRIVTAIEMRQILGLTPRDAVREAPMSIVVDRGGDLYALIVDQVGEVLTLDPTRFEPTPPMLDSAWKDVATGISRLEGSLLVILDLDRLLAQAAH